MRARLIHVAPVTPTLEVGVRNVEPWPQQVRYVGNTAFNLADAQADPRSWAMAILADGRVIGFYRLDLAADDAPAAARREVFVRALVIDRREQGNGYGMRGLRALHADLARRMPQLRLVRLNVHCSNRGAYQLYCAAGYVDTGLFAPGRAGVQHRLLCALSPAFRGQSHA